MADVVEWRDIPGYEGIYQASSAGDIRVIRRHPKGNTEAGHVLSPQMHRNGYMNVGLWRAGKRSVVGVHRLVATAFYGLPPERMDASHRDGDRSNNAAINLRWATHEENEADKREHGTQYSHFKGRAACSQGHKYTPENTYLNGGRRNCRACNNERARARREKARKG